MTVDLLDGIVGYDLDSFALVGKNDVHFLGLDWGVWGGGDGLDVANNGESQKGNTK